MRAASSIGVRALAAIAALLAVSCRSRPALPEIGAIRVADGALGDPVREVGLAPADLERAARDALTSAGFKIGDGKGGHRVTVDVLSMHLASPHPGEPGPRVEVVVELELEPPQDGGGASLRESGAGSAALSAGPARAWNAAVGAAARDAAGVLALGLVEAAKPIERVIADLGAEDARVREQAIRVLAERRDPAAVPALIARLKDPDPELVQRTVGALAQIRDPRAVGPIIDVANAGDPAVTARMARIIGDLGGPEAKGYLLTLEAGHPDLRVQRAAREALAEMAARAADAARATAGK